MEDLHGNYMNYVYQRDQERLYIQSIQYTGNNQQSLSTHAAVEFLYVARPDNAVDQYAAGFQQRMTQRLDKILVKAAGSLQRQYLMQYAKSPSTNRSLLEQITLVNAAGDESLPPMTFMYQDGPLTNQEFENMSMFDQVGASDGVWNYRFVGGWDVGGSNIGSLHSSQVPNGPTQTQASGSWGAGSSWSTSNGSLNVSAPQDSLNLLWTYVYVDQDTNVDGTLIRPGGIGGDINVWINKQKYYYNHNNTTIWNLKQGYNLI